MLLVARLIPILAKYGISKSIGTVEINNGTKAPKPICQNALILSASLIPILKSPGDFFALVIVSSFKLTLVGGLR